MVKDLSRESGYYRQWVTASSIPVPEKLVRAAHSKGNSVRAVLINMSRVCCDAPVIPGWRTAGRLSSKAVSK